MKKEIMEKWATALESGDYKQGRGRLRDGDQFCCLGVLCDLMDPDGWDFVSKYDGNAGIPPPKVIEWASINPEGSFKGEETLETLAAMNDGDASFKEIASAIRENWRDL